MVNSSDKEKDHAHGTRWAYSDMYPTSTYKKDKLQPKQELSPNVSIESTVVVKDETI